VVEDFRVLPNAQVEPGSALALMYDHDLEMKLTTLEREIYTAELQFRGFSEQLGVAPENEKAKIRTEMQNQRATADAKTKQREALMLRTNSEPGQRGYYWLKAPAFPPGMPVGEGTPTWKVLNGDFRENLRGKQVKPSDPILRLGYNAGHWEIEMKIPQKHIGQVLAAFKTTGKDVLDVDVLVRSEPDRVFKGKLERDRIAAEGNAEKDERNEQEPQVLAYVRLDGDGIADSDCLPKVAPHLLVAATEVHAKVRCGNYRMGYSLFYGVWEFIYEKFVFFF
jgi:hypothetical protein